MVYGPQVLEEFKVVAASYPDVRLAVDHLNLGGIHTIESMKDSVERLCELARFPNVSVKASALPCHLATRPPFAELDAVVYRAMEAFGPDRVFWGSDLSRLPCPYADWVEFAKRAMSSLSDHDRGCLLGLAIAKWLQIEPAPA